MASSEQDQELERTIIERGRVPDPTPLPDAIAHYLVIMEGADTGRRVELAAPPLTIGRDQRRTIVFPDTEVSRLHAQVGLVGDEAVAEDLGSTNGTFVDGERITGRVTLREGSVLRIGRQLLKYERRSRRDVQRSEEMDRDLLKARSYVLSLLPAPLQDGRIHVDWLFLPSAQLGGDAFGYAWIDPDTFAIYLIDVSGHGVGPAMHSVAVMNLMRQRALPGVDFSRPADVLSSLNTRFQMDSHDGMCFTMWYGVYRPSTRTLTYATAGHHPAYVVPPGRNVAQPLGMSGLMIGTWEDVTYLAADTTLAPASTLYLFSDGVFEIATTEQRWTLTDFLPHLLGDPIADTPEPERLYQEVRHAAVPGPLDDDFSLLVATFP